MDSSRREFWVTLGAAACGPLLWAEAEAQVEQTGEVAAETVRMLLDLQGRRGIYENPERFEELRAAVGRTIRTHQGLRSFAMSDDVPPALVFKRG